MRGRPKAGCAASRPQIQHRLRSQTRLENRAALLPSSRTWGASPPPRVTSDTRAAVRAGTPGTGPRPAPRAPGAKGPLHDRRADPSRERPFLRRALGPLCRLLFPAVTLTGIGSALPETPFGPVRHGRGGRPRGASALRTPPPPRVHGLHASEHFRHPSAAACARPFRAPPPLASPCACVLSLRHSGYVSACSVLRIRGVRFARRACADSRGEIPADSLSCGEQHNRLSVCNLSSFGKSKVVACREGPHPHFAYCSMRTAVAALTPDMSGLVWSWIYLALSMKP